MTPSQKLRSIADSTGLDGIADAIREIAEDIEHNNAPAVQQGDEHAAFKSAMKAEYGLLKFDLTRSQGGGYQSLTTHAAYQGWKVARAASPAPAVPQGWKLVPVEPTREMIKAMEGQWLIGSQADMAKREYSTMLAATPAPAPAQGEPFGYFRAEPFGWTDCAKDDEGAIALYERPQEVGLTDEQTLKDAYQEGYYARVTYNDAEESDLETEWSKSSTKALIAARAKGQS